MNRQDSLRPITRRALRIDYISPGICMPPVEPSSGGSSGDSGGMIDFTTTTKLPGPFLSLDYLYEEVEVLGLNLFFGNYAEGSAAFSGLTPGATYRWIRGVESSRLDNVITFVPAEYDSYTDSTDFIANTDAVIVRTDEVPSAIPVTGSLQLVTSSLQAARFRLSWTPVPGAVFYQIFRATSANGPFVFLQGPVGGTEYIDTPPAPGLYFYRVTAIEPNAGETEASNVVVGDLNATLPVAGASLWVSSRSQKFSDVAGTIPSDGGEIQFWQDLSGNDNHLKFNSGNSSSNKGPLDLSSQFFGQRGAVFGDTPGANNLTGLITDDLLSDAGGVTVFLVGAFRNPSSGTPGVGGVLFNLRNGNIQIAQDLSGEKRLVTTRNLVSPVELSDPTIVGEAYNLVAFRASEALNEQRLYRNGTSVDSDTLGPVVLGGRLGIGFRDGLFNPGGNLSGTIIEMVVYMSPLSDSDVAAMNSFLKGKYNL